MPFFRGYQLLWGVFSLGYWVYRGAFFPRILGIAIGVPFFLGYLVWGAFFPRISGVGVPEFLTRKGCQISQGGA